ncbi:hypothetical protein OH76DRAFT_1559009 [Lentinus brumalis]|uniref:BTB domain-containing protein n=1 Tax=Lentinus brumalis TaxID=2498619 RepID=A0A371CZ46_9APHY|nr:hypothetical protein OH76DRAFT_1559009 [Polyporus brumalis]
MSDSDSDSSSGTVRVHYGPFRNAAVGDLIIETFDGDRFHVSKSIMAVASVYFAHRYPPPTSTSPTLPSKKTRTVVSEDSTLWEKVITLIYSSLEEPIPIAALGALLEATKKYRMAGVANVLGQMLLRADLMDTEPLRVYALASGFGFPDAARIAARRMLRLPAGLEYTSELQYTSAAAYHRLVEYRRRCVEVIRPLLHWEVLKNPKRVHDELGLEYRVEVACPSWITTDLEELMLCRGRMKSAEGAIFVSFRETELCGIEYVTGVYAHPAWREAMEELEKASQLVPDVTPCFSPTFLEPLMKASGNTLNGPAGLVANAHTFTVALDKQISQAIAKVVLETD